MKQENNFFAFSEHHNGPQDAMQLIDNSRENNENSTIISVPHRKRQSRLESLSEEISSGNNHLTHCFYGSKTCRQLWNEFTKGNYGRVPADLEAKNIFNWRNNKSNASGRVQWHRRKTY